MKPEKTKIELYKRDSAFASLKEFCIMSIHKDGEFIEVSEWYNGEGFDVEVVTNNNMRFQLTHGQFDALKKLVKQLGKRKL
jgi:hypothetical protein